MPTKAEKNAAAQTTLDGLQEFINEIVAHVKRGQKRKIREHLLYLSRHRVEHGYNPKEAQIIDKEAFRAIKQGLKDLKAGEKVHPLIKQIATAQRQQFS